MNKKEEFEALLGYIANLPVSFAGGKSSRPSGANKSRHYEDISEEDILKELRRAKTRQKKNPSLFCGDPEGFFTYDDPVLAIAAYLYQSHLLMSSVIGIAGERGEDLRNESYWNWAKTAVHIWLSRNDESYKTLMGMTPHETIEIDKDVVRLAVTGDAGFQGQAQSNVIYSIRDKHRSVPFDLLIHLGDIYFAGHGAEFLRHFLAPFRSAGPRVLTLVGNHDLYFGGEAFINALKDLQQPGRYFCVETPHWRVLCLDTALPAETLRRNSGLLDEGQMIWLDKQLEKGDGKKMILMSHHYIVSGWGNSSDRLKRQLGSRLNKIFAWYWGHEHGCVTYDKKSAGFHGACIGNGAFLEVWKPPSRSPSPEWYATGRCSCYREQSEFWPHGYLELELQPQKIIENYHLENEEFYQRILERE